jgi:hypothetical protein
MHQSSDKSRQWQRLSFMHQGVGRLPMDKKLTACRKVGRMYRRDPAKSRPNSCRNAAFSARFHAFGLPGSGPPAAPGKKKRAVSRPASRNN